MSAACSKHRISNLQHPVSEIVALRRTLRYRTGHAKSRLFFAYGAIAPRGRTRLSKVKDLGRISNRIIVKPDVSPPCHWLLAIQFLHARQIVQVDNVLALTVSNPSSSVDGPCSWTKRGFSNIYIVTSSHSTRNLLHGVLASTIRPIGSQRNEPGPC
jgi:hypothetical protein